MAECDCCGGTAGKAVCWPCMQDLRTKLADAKAEVVQLKLALKDAEIESNKRAERIMAAARYGR